MKEINHYGEREKKNINLSLKHFFKENDGKIYVNSLPASSFLNVQWH